MVIFYIKKKSTFSKNGFCSQKYFWVVTDAHIIRIRIAKPIKSAGQIAPPHAVDGPVHPVWF